MQIRNLFTTLLAALTLAACTNSNEKMSKSENDKMKLSFSAEQAAWMSAIACNEAKGDLVALEAAIHNGLEAELTVSQIKEALSQLYAYTGFPRSLNALGVLQRVIGDRQAKGVKVIMGEDASALPDDYDALERGTAVQTQLTGKPFNYEFAPATDYYLKAHLFGDIFARDNLTFADRELVTVSALSGLEGVEPQLKAHIAGARNMGVSEEQLQGIVVALAANGLLNEAGRLAKAYNELSPSNLPTSLNSQLSTLNSPWPQVFHGTELSATIFRQCGECDVRTALPQQLAYSPRRGTSADLRERQGLVSRMEQTRSSAYSGNRDCYS